MLGNARAYRFHNHFRISLHPRFTKFFMEWTMFIDSYLHEVVHIGEVIESLYPALVARITISHPPSAQSSFRLYCLHQCLLDTDVTSGARPVMTRVTNNVVPLGS